MNQPGVFAIFRKHARLMTLLLCFAILCGLVYSIYSRPVFYSKARVQASDSESASRLNGTIGDLQSAHLLERAARRFGLKGNAREVQLHHVQRMLVRAVHPGDLEVEVWTTSRDLAAQWAQALVEEYEAYRAEKYESDKDEIFARYTREFQDAAVRMGKSPRADFHIRSEQDALRAVTELQEAQGQPAEMVRMTKRIDDMGKVRIQLEDADLDVAAKLSLMDKVGSPEAQSAAQWQDLLKEQRRLTAEIAVKAAAAPRDEAAMQALNAELETTTLKLSEEFPTAKKRFETDYQNLLNRRSEIESGVEEKANALGAPPAKLTVPASAKARPNWDRMVSDLKKKVEQLEERWSTERVNLSFRELVVAPKVPISPNRRVVFLVSLLAGLLLALGLPLVIEALNQTTHPALDFEATLQLRRLGTASDAASPNAGSLEEYRTISKNLLNAAGIKGVQVTMVAGAVGGEGKTALSGKLAAAFAEEAGRTLLIDADLARARVHRLFGYRKSPGLANILRGECTLEKACRRTGIDNFWMLPAGDSKGSDEAIGVAHGLAEILPTLRKQFARILIDTPPVLENPAGRALFQHADVTVLAVASGQTRIRSARAAIDALHAAGATLCGFVLNCGVPAEPASLAPPRTPAAKDSERALERV